MLVHLAGIHVVVLDAQGFLFFVLVGEGELLFGQVDGYHSRTTPGELSGEPALCTAQIECTQTLQRLASSQQPRPMYLVPAKVLA